MPQSSDEKPKKIKSSDEKTKKSKTTKSAPTIEETYKKKTQREHILHLPDTYIGSVEADKKEMWVFDQELGKIVKNEITFVSGFYKTFDELAVNARDNTERDPTCNVIKINLDQKTGVISVWNNGEGIPVVMHKEHNVYVPELIFGHLLTSTNYDKKKKTVGGKNGYGAKLANIFSTKFVVETVDSVNKKKYIQEYNDNMSIIGTPNIQSVPASTKPYTFITYYPDYARFGMDGLTDDIMSLLIKRCYDLAACCINETEKRKKVKVYFNDKHLPIATFEDYIQMYYKTPVDVVYDGLVDRWKVGIVFDPNAGHEQISFVNGLWTYRGGTHVNYVMDQIIKKVTEHIKKKYKLNVKPAQIREQLTIFLDAIIDDPSFESQTKDTLTTKATNFGTEYVVDNGFMTKLYKTKLIDEVVKFAQFKELQQLNKSDGTKKSSIIGIDKLDDALWAGTRRSKETRLIITEGDSAKAFATSGIEIIGREKYGAWPIRGKGLNVRNASTASIQKNKEFTTFKTIMGLKQNVEYTDTTKLRYGGIIILTDQDLDGSHIKGLIINMLQYFWPSLLKIDGFIQTMSTPILKVNKKTDKARKDVKTFYTISDYKKWATTIDDISKWNIKYYKGLATSEADEVKELFNEFTKRIITYVWDEVEKTEDDSVTGSKSYEKIVMAFDEDKVSDRKEWLSKYNPDDILEYDKQNVTFSEFIDKDLIHFSNYDNIRMIPSLCDGFKPSQRKILFGAYQKNLFTSDKEIRVSQLASYVSEHTAYKHGETSLCEAIINMAQNFAGSNNINLLYPAGNFGYRKMGGDDHGAARYIHTFIESITPKIFRKEDDPVLTYVEDEGEIVEPETYAPIIPMILVNGGIGIGYGFSTKVVPYNALDVANNIMRKLDDKPMLEMFPHFHKFQGKIERLEEYKYKMTGNYEILDDETIRITEMPVVGQYAWSDKYKIYLESHISVDKSDNKILTAVKSNCGNDSIMFDITFKGNEMQKLIKNGEVEKFLKISTTIATTNFYLYNANKRLVHYDNYDDILEEFYEYRLDIYAKRKAYMIRYLENELKILEYRVKFIKQILDKTIIIERQKKDIIFAKLEKLEYPKLSHNIDDPAEQKSYGYLSSMDLFALTEEKIDDLNAKYLAKKTEYDDYFSITTKELWKRELAEFIDAYKIWDAERLVNKNKKDKSKKKDSGEKSTKPTKTKTKGKTTKK